MNANRVFGMHEISVAMVHQSMQWCHMRHQKRYFPLRVDLQRGERSEAKKQILTVAEQVDVRSAKRATVRSVRLLWSIRGSCGPITRQYLPVSMCSFVPSQCLFPVVLSEDGPCTRFRVS